MSSDDIVNTAVLGSASAVISIHCFANMWCSYSIYQLKFPLKLLLRKSTINQRGKMLKIISVKMRWIHTEASP